MKGRWSLVLKLQTHKKPMIATGLFTFADRASNKVESFISHSFISSSIKTTYEMKGRIHEKNITFSIELFVSSLTEVFHLNKNLFC